jgi:acyl-phosphate glycerol 3-phosphate acyltransferase
MTKYYMVRVPKRTGKSNGGDHKLPNEFLIILICGYIIGSFPVGGLVRLLRRYGVTTRGALGTVNKALGPLMQPVLNLMPAAWAETVLETWPIVIGNFFKGIAAVLLARAVIGSQTAMVGAGITAMWGHAWPVFLRFKSERGSATILGVLSIVAPVSMTVWCVLWILMFGITRYTVIASLVSFVVLPFILWEVKGRDLYVFFGVLCSATAVAQLYGGLQRVFEGKSRRADEGGALTEADLEEEEEKSEPVRQSRTRARIALGFVGFLIFALWFANKYVYRGFGQQVPVIRSGGPYYKVVALTFDDGPDPEFTPEILDLLKQNDVKATFFLVGTHAEKYPGLVKRIIAEGHEIGNHSYSHPVNMLLFSRDRIVQEVVKAEEAITRAGGVRPYLFRPPRGLFNKVLMSILRDRKYTMVLWSLSSRDWQEPSYKEITWRVCTGVKNGDIVLFHDSGSLISPEGGNHACTIDALPYVIKGLRERGYRFVPLTDMIIMSDLNGDIQ